MKTILIFILLLPCIALSQTDTNKILYLNAFDYIIKNDSLKKTIVNQYKVNKSSDYSICASNRIYDLGYPYFLDSVIFYEYGIKNSVETHKQYDERVKDILYKYNNRKRYPPYSVNYFDCDTLKTDFIISFSSVAENNKLYARIAQSRDYYDEYQTRILIDQSIVILLYFDDKKIIKMFYGVTVH